MTNLIGPPPSIRVKNCPVLWNWIAHIPRTLTSSHGISGRCVLVLEKHASHNTHNALYPFFHPTIHPSQHTHSFLVKCSFVLYFPAARCWFFTCLVGQSEVNVFQIVCTYIQSAVISSFVIFYIFTTECV